MSKHTPGPWGYRWSEKDGVFKILAKATKTTGNQLIGEILVVEDDARLIAAAPELLLACEGALVALQLGAHVDQKQAIDYLGEVIVKAKGLEK